MSPATSKRGDLHHLDNLGYDKLLGMGKITKSMVVKVAAHSEAAGKKLEEAGGQILQEKG